MQHAGFTLPSTSDFKPTFIFLVHATNLNNRLDKSEAVLQQVQSQGLLAAAAVQPADLNAAVSGASAALVRQIGELKGALAGMEARVEAVAGHILKRDEAVMQVGNWGSL